MGAGRFPAHRRAGVLGVVAAAALATACSTTAAVAPAAARAAWPGGLTLGTFPATTDGAAALGLCRQWAGLRGQYAAQLRRDTAFQLEQWFSTSPQWLVAFTDNSPLKTDPRYVYITVAFGLAAAAEAASLSSARLLDDACAAAD
jgi:hypothetical protein